jgi:hypothetical protein
MKYSKLSPLLLFVLLQEQYDLALSQKQELTELFLLIRHISSENKFKVLETMAEIS